MKNGGTCQQSPAKLFLNRSPHRGLTNETSYEILYGIKPSLSKLKVFDCAAYSTMPKTKLFEAVFKIRYMYVCWLFPDFKGYRFHQRCTLFGYSETSKDTDYIRGVLFLENQFEFAENDSTSSLFPEKSSEVILILVRFTLANEEQP